LALAHLQPRGNIINLQNFHVRPTKIQPTSNRWHVEKLTGNSTGTARRKLLILDAAGIVGKP
jgi:hypothetical protein